VTLALGDRVGLEDLPGLAPVSPNARVAIPVLGDEGLDIDAFLSDIERRVLLAALERAGGVRTSAAKLLKTTFRSFRYRLAKYGLAEADSGDGDE
jgi:two-component system response regulator PilR (NtrC family)